jgi:hypothetical protein
LGAEAWKDLYRAVWFDRAGRPIDENHVIVRALRSAQLEALRKTLARFDPSCATDLVFSEKLGRYIKEHEASLTANDA